MLGEEIRRRRERLQLTQAELAARLTVSPNTLARWERDELGIRHPQMLRAMLTAIETEVYQSLQTEDGRERWNARADSDTIAPAGTTTVRISDGTGHGEACGRRGEHPGSGAQLRARAKSRL